MSYGRTRSKDTWNSASLVRENNARLIRQGFLIRYKLVDLCKRCKLRNRCDFPVLLERSIYIHDKAKTNGRLAAQVERSIEPSQYRKRSSSYSVLQPWYPAYRRWYLRLGSYKLSNWQEFGLDYTNTSIASLLSKPGSSPAELKEALGVKKHLGNFENSF